MVAILRHRLHVHLLLTLPQTLNATNLSTQCCLLTPGLKLYALPYSLMGFVLHATTYYVLGCIAILQGSTTTLRPIKNPLRHEHTMPHQRRFRVLPRRSKRFHYTQSIGGSRLLATNAVLPLLAGVSGVQSLWEHETDWALWKMMDSVFLVYLVPVALAIANVMDMGRPYLSRWVALGVLVGMGLSNAAERIFKKKEQNEEKEIEKEMVGGESWVLRCITAVFASFVGLPFFMDLLLAVVMHDWKGLPTGESRYVMMFFVAYVGACFLPLFSL
ncbi:hypothetical protein HBI47_118450 [Parastagonospora nodorum]|nr:hypothetical protein HBI47_118450 [Parastagonospora nodorum]